MTKQVKETWQLGDQTIEVSHLDRVYWPQTGYSKRELLQYYQQIAGYLLPHLRDRPVTLRVYPKGVEGTSYYLRDCPEEAPAWLRRTPYQPKTVKHAIPLPLIDTVAGLLWFANRGALEFHQWGSHIPKLEEPDFAIFDLDPGESVPNASVREAALRLHDVLQQHGVKGYPKTTGGNGLHVFVPLEPGQSFQQVRTWVKTIGQHLAEAHPNLIALARGATHRGDRVTIDYAQNSVGRNTAAPYTLRARHAHPTVSTPLSWTELEQGSLNLKDLTPQVVLERARQLGDLFAPLLSPNRQRQE